MFIFKVLLQCQQGLSQRPVRPSFGRAVSKLDGLKILKSSLWTSIFFLFIHFFVVIHEEHGNPIDDNETIHLTRVPHIKSSASCYCTS